jgi:hypothetical protein
MRVYSNTMGLLVCFFSDGGFINNRIVKYQKLAGFTSPSCDITHVGILGPWPYVVGARFPFSEAVNILDAYQGRQYDVLRWKGTGVNDPLLNQVAFWGASKCNLPYGWPGLLGFYIKTALPFIGKNPLSWKKAPFCSQFCGFAFRRVGLDPCPGVPNGDLTPAHLRASDSFIKVTNGGDVISSGHPLQLLEEKKTYTYKEGNKD